MLEINIFFPSNRTLKPRLNCPTAKPLAFKPELLLALECCIPIITTYIILKKTLKNNNNFLKV